MRIGVFEVVRPIHDRAERRLGRRYVMGFDDTRLTVQRSGPVRPSAVYVEDFPTYKDVLANGRVSSSGVSTTATRSSGGAKDSHFWHGSVNTHGR